MCFTLSLHVEQHRLEKALQSQFKTGYRFEPFYFKSAFDFPSIPVLTSQSQGYFTPMAWGLTPYWVKTVTQANEIRSKTLNARIENLFEKPSFSDSANKYRCIIPASGFFEWQHLNNRKIPWYITSKDYEILPLAGIYSQWVNPETGEIAETFSIITLPANRLMEKIHNTKKRMPAMLTMEQIKQWLDPNLSTKDYGDILKPINDDLLKAYTVSPLVSNPTKNRNVPEIINPYNYPAQTILF